ncbi:MAG: GntR family transcriptional regulator [Thomasclavelia sp.]|uniref:GntR family transcriptional regulator n=1 Tax=Thomasclavelia sp. TaxID=3025757 RepID=UPI0039A2C8D8
MIINLNYNSEIPIYLQLRNEIVRGIGSGQFKYGESLPTVRTLASDLHVNNMTVNKAYSLLKQEGYICIDRRHGAKVLPSKDSSMNFKEQIFSDLQLLASEAIVKGMNKSDFLSLCNEMVQQLQYEAKLSK